MCNFNDKTWFLWDDEDRSPFLNMAIDELLLSESADFAKPLIRIYGWDRPSVSIGYVQNYDAAPQKGYTIVRRPTGGGVVFHDVDLTYTAVIPPHHQIDKLDRLESYHVFHRAVLLALAEFGLKGELAKAEEGPVDRATMQCFVTPTRYDVVCENRKYAGAAQRRTRDGILHQGSIFLEASGGDKDKLKSALIAGLKQQFNIGFDLYKPDTKLLESAEKLAVAKYATDKWNIEREFCSSD